MSDIFSGSDSGSDSGFFSDSGRDVDNVSEGAKPEKDTTHYEGQRRLDVSNRLIAQIDHMEMEQEPHDIVKDGAINAGIDLRETFQMAHNNETIETPDTGPAQEISPDITLKVPFV